MGSIQRTHCTVLFKKNGKYIFRTMRLRALHLLKSDWKSLICMHLVLQKVNNSLNENQIEKKGFLNFNTASICHPSMITHNSITIDDLF